MSHVEDIKLKVKDLEALKQACAPLGLEFMKGQRTYKWFGYSVGDYPIPEGMTAEDLGKCHHAIRIKDNDKAYEIGVIAQPDGTYRLLWDFWSGGFGLQDKIGPNGAKLTSEYAKRVAMKQLLREGYRVTETKDDQGILLEFTI